MSMLLWLQASFTQSSSLAQQYSVTMCEAAGKLHPELMTTAALRNSTLLLSSNLCVCVSAGKLHPELMTAAAWHSSSLMHAFQPQSVANMIWAYATLAHNPPAHFLDLLCSHAMHELPHFSPQNISNTIWALATLKWQSKVSWGWGCAV